MRQSFFSAVILLAFCSAAHASIINNLNGTITQIKDDGTKLMWLQDANYAKTSGFDPVGPLTNASAISWANSLTFAGYTGWRLPTANSHAAGDNGYRSDSEMGDLYYNELGNTGGSFVNAGPFFNIQPYWYWTSTEFQDPRFVMVFSFFDIPNSPVNEAGWQDTGDRFAETWTWLVRDATNDPPATVPEPAVIKLLSAGLIGIAGMMKKRRVQPN